MIVIATHAVFANGKDLYGPPHAVSLYLSKTKQSHLFIKHNLFGDSPYSVIETYEKGKLKSAEKKSVKSTLAIIRWLKEIILTITESRKAKEPVSLFIGVNPLNCMAGIFLKLTKKSRSVIYFSADFAIKRFENTFINTIYHKLDTLSMSNADQTWSVSQRIVEYRRKKGLPAKQNKLLPNAPFFDEIKRLPINKINKNNIVVVSALSENIAFDTLIESMVEIKKVVKDISLTLIGSGPKKNHLVSLAKRLGLSRNIKFTGSLSHDNMFKVITKCGIGVALYAHSDPEHFRYFSDPMKVRDYLASGLPTLISGNSAIGTELERKGAGFIVELEKKDIVNKLKSMLTGKTRYEKMRGNAIALAKEYDTYRLIHSYISAATRT